ncbi:MAG: DsbA family protein, partial [Gammaproteobacteria bacterium]
MIYYVLDPMCSWCWGFNPALEMLLEALPPGEKVRYVMGGLAPDSTEPMPAQTREYVREQWRLVSARTGAHFNWDFWERCRPRRSTWPACRAVIAAGLQGERNVPGMIRAIQEAYYLQARNPSEREVLIELAGEIGLDPHRFALDLE